tara:strand:- start:795 stop:1091 length:297 start_codon:yes stop_codon:yes gene_type:complete
MEKKPAKFSARKAANAKRQWKERYKQIKIGKAIALLAAMDKHGQLQVLNALMDTGSITFHALVPHGEEDKLRILEVEMLTTETEKEIISIWCEGSMNV